jgi:polyisoprenoid-binding protein YceI
MSSLADNTPHGSPPTAKAARDAARKAAKAARSTTQVARRAGLAGTVKLYRRRFGISTARWASEIMEAAP